MVRPVLVRSWVKARVTDKSPVITMIPAKSGLILPRTCKSPVSAPAASPARKLKRMAGRAGIPSLSIRMAQTTPPRGKVPSTERSGKSRIE